MKKLLAIILTVTMMLSLSSSLAEGKTWTNDENSELTILCITDNIPNENNMVLEKLRELTGVKLNIIAVMGEDYPTKLNAMIAAGDVPDIFYCPSLTDSIAFKEAGIIANMEDVLNAVAPNVIEETKDIIRSVQVNKDGIYMVPNANIGYPTNLCIRTDWLANLGLEMPTDLDSFAKVMHAFTYDDPDKNGKDDTFGLCWYWGAFTGKNEAFSTIFGAYGIPKCRPIELDGKVTTWVKHPKFMDAMKYIRALVDDGVGEPEYMTLVQLDAFAKLWNGVAGAIEWECVGPTNNWMPGRYTEDPVPTFDFAVLKGPDGEYGSAAIIPSLASGWMFSATSKNLEGAAKVANFCMSEKGSELLRLGVEDVMWKWVDKENGKIEYLGEYADSATIRANGGYVYWRMFIPKNNAQDRTLNKQTQEGVALARTMMIDWCNIQGVMESQVQYGADMDQVINEMLAELLTCDVSEMDAVYEEYIAEWENAGGKAWEDEATALWAEENK